MNSKCKCQNCSESVEFPNEMAGQIVECPHCKLETKLFVPPPPAAPKSNPPQKSKADSENIADKKSESIERNLRAVGRLFFWIGLICLIICGIAVVSYIFIGLFIRSLEVDEVQGAELALGLGIVVFFQTSIVSILFQAFAEIIRLLRQIAARP